MRNSHGRTLNMARNTEKHAKWKTHNVGPGIWQQNWKTLKIWNSHDRTWNMERYTEKRAKWERNTIGHGMWQETVKNVKHEKYNL